MGILGLTHDENGTALEKLPVTMKVAIGEGPEPGSVISFSNGKRFGAKTWCGCQPQRSLKRMGRSRPNWESSSSTTIHAKSSKRSTPYGRRADASAEANLYRSRMAAGPGSKCKRLGGRKSTLRGSLGLATTSISMVRRKASRLSPAVTVAPIWSVEIAGHREISTSSWRSSRCSALSAGFTPVAIDRFATSPTA